MVKVEHSPQQASLDPHPTERDQAVHETVEYLEKSTRGVVLLLSGSGMRSDTNFTRDGGSCAT